MDSSSCIKYQNRSYLHFQKTYGNHTWLTDELSWWTATSKVTWPCDHVATWSHVTNKKRHISTSPRPLIAYFGKVEIYSTWPLSIKSFDALGMWSSDHVTDKKRYISTSARVWLPNFTKWWVLMPIIYKVTQPVNHIRSYNKWKTL